MSNIKNLKIISIPKISDPHGRGNLSFIEKNIIPFKLKEFTIYMMFQVMAQEEAMLTRS